MLSRLFGRGSTATTLERPEAVSGEGFQLVSAVLDGRRTHVFVAPQGTAAAVEVGEERATVLTGLAAGIVLSDVEEAQGGPSSGLAASSSRISRLSPRDADGLIDGLGALTDGQKGQLRTALSL